jgi:hypothetical protein
MDIELLVDPATGWSRRDGEVATWIKESREDGGCLQASNLDLPSSVDAADAVMQLGRRVGWGTPWNVARETCVQGTLGFATFIGGPSSDLRMWLVVRSGSPATMFSWIGEDESLGDEAEQIVLASLGLEKRPESFFENNSRPH